MNYLMLIWADGRPAPDDLAAMRHAIPGWVEEMDGRGVRLLGRELELPETAATVRVRDGETLVTDGPFAETKEFMAGFDLLDCADLDEAIDAASKHASSWFQTIEIRPFADGVRLGENASAFGRGEDGATRPYLLIAWTAGERPPVDEVEAWRHDVEARRVHVLGGRLGAADTATTVRVRGGETRLGDGPLTGTDEYVAAVDVVSCAQREQAIELAAAHPVARHHAIEVRPFWSE